MQEGHPLDNLLLEIKSYKFAQNREFKECMRPAVEVVLDLAGADRGNVSLVIVAAAAVVVDVVDVEDSSLYP